MTRPTTTVSIALVAVLALAAASTGCSAGKSGTSSSGASSSQTRRQPIVPADLKQLSPAEKQSAIASSFPMQVPVPAGAVSRGEAQGDSAWDYQLTVDATPYAVAAWYHITYAQSEWQLVNSTESNGSVSMDFEKGTAQSRITVAPAAGGKSRVTASVGVGTPVLQTQ